MAYYRMMGAAPTPSVTIVCNDIQHHPQTAYTVSSAERQ
jgi:hypothetical protein